MRTFVVRLNPDPRANKPYSKYATKKEYSDIQFTNPMNGFEECANYLVEQGRVKGYLPPKHSSSMRDGKPFNLITITAKTASNKADEIVGIQYNCIYMGENIRVNPNWQDRSLYWHYSCRSNDSILFSESILDARNIILGRNLKWRRNPTFKLEPSEVNRVLKLIHYKANKLDKLELEKHTLDFNDNTDLLIEEDEIDLGVEDLTKIRIHKSVERDPSFIKKVKNHLRYICQACEINLEVKYGEVGKGYIEVHHLRPVSLNKGIKHRPDIKDFAVLCPNCHRMIHRSKYIDDLKAFKTYILKNAS